MGLIGSTGICRRLNIKPGRFRVWVDQYLEPEVPPDGHGTRTRWHPVDVYVVAIFLHLITNGFSRRFAARLIKGLSKRLRREDINSLDLIWMEWDADEVYPPVFLHYDINTDTARPFPETILIINFTSIKNMVKED